MEVRKRIRPSGMTFAFNLDDTRCHKVKTGVCSLDLKEAELSEFNNDRSSVGYCQYIAKKLIETKGNWHGTLINRATCGHYNIVNGTHRLCIAKQLEMEIIAEVGENDTVECTVCNIEIKKEFRNKNKKFSIKSIFKKEKEEESSFKLY